VTLLSLSRSTKPIGLSFGSFSHWYAAAIIAGVAYVAVLAGVARRGPARATLIGLAAGLVFGIQDALTRQTLELLQGQPVAILLTNWAPYCLLGAGIVGLWLMQNAFSAGPLHASLPTIAAGEPVAGIALGIVVFGDRIQVSPGMLAIEAGGIAALIVGVVAVARSSAFTSLRKITEVITPAHHQPHLPHRPERLALGPDNPRTHRRGDLNGLRPNPADTNLADTNPADTAPVDVAPAGAAPDGPASGSAAAGPLEEPALDTGPLDVGQPRRAHRRPFHRPASGEEGG
jgi:hypothetical protein